MQNLGNRLEIDFSTSESEERLSEFFIQYGILGMLEAVDYENIDHISLLWGGNGRFTLWQHRNGTGDRSVSLYVDLNDTIQRRFCRSGWTENELILLGAQINSFRNLSAKVFGSYQLSNTVSPKWHATSHLADLMKRIESFEYLDSGTFESSHKHFKCL